MAVKNDDGPLARALKKAVKKKKTDPYKGDYSEENLAKVKKEKAESFKKKKSAMNPQEVARGEEATKNKWRKEDQNSMKWLREWKNKQQSLKENPKNNTKPRPKSTKKS
jgi:hypothetical protein